MSTEIEKNHSIVFDSMTQCASATGIPLAALRLAKRSGCDAFKSNRVFLSVFLRWWFTQESTDLNTDWSKELRKEQTLRERIRRQEDEDRVIDAEKVRAFHGRLIGGLFADLDRVFANELPPALKGLDESAVRTRALAEIESVKNRLRQLLTVWETERHTACSKSAF